MNNNLNEKERLQNGLIATGDLQYSEGDFGKFLNIANEFITKMRN